MIDSIDSRQLCTLNVFEELSAIDEKKKNNFVKMSAVNKLFISYFKKERRIYACIH